MIILRHLPHRLLSFLKRSLTHYNIRTKAWSDKPVQLSESAREGA